MFVVLVRTIRSEVIVTVLFSWLRFYFHGYCFIFMGNVSLVDTCVLMYIDKVLDFIVYLYHFVFL